MDNIEDRVYRCEMDIKDLRNDLDNNTKEDKQFRKYVRTKVEKIDESLDSIQKWIKRQTVSGLVLKTILVVAITGVGNSLLNWVNSLSFLT